jgi:NTE family protein
MHTSHRLARHGRVAAVVAPLLAMTFFLVGPSNAQADPERPRIGLVLGGGGAKGIAHVGVLQWLEEHRIPVDLVVGTSMGGLVGGTYAVGMSPPEIAELLRTADWDVIMMPDAPYSRKAYRRKEDARAYPVKLELGLRDGVQLPSGLNPGHHIGTLLSRIALPYSTVERFDDLPIPFRCVAVDMRKGEEFVLGEGSLATALRATMAIPAVFDPVRVDGQLLLSDGGILDNVPVDVAKAMGAEVVIAVKVGSPQFDEVSESLLGLANRAISLMMDRISDPRIAQADVLVFPLLKGYSSADWTKTDELIPLGYEAAEAVAPQLLRFAIGEESWRQHLATRAARKRTPPEEPAFIDVTGVPERAAKVLARNLEAESRRHGWSPKAFETGLERIVGSGRFSAAGYALAQRDGEQGYRVGVREKTHGPPFLNFFIDVSNQQEDVDFNLGARATLMNPALFGWELRLDGTFGSNLGGRGELFVPVRTKGFFVAPQGFYLRSKRSFYQDDALVAIYREDRSGGGGDVGWLLGSSGQVRLGYATTYIKSRPRVGDPGLEAASGREEFLLARASVDRFDEPNLPRSGIRGEARLAWFLRAPGATDDFGVLSASLTGFWPTHGADRAFLSGTAQTSLGPEAPTLYEPALGGFLNLSAFGTNEFRGRHSVVARAGYLRSLVKLPDLLGDRLFLAGIAELGSAFDEVDAARLKWSASLALAGDTFFGPVYFGFALGNGWSYRGYVTIGRLLP